MLELSVWILLLVLSCLPDHVTSVKRQDFKTCAQSGFCRRLRDLPASTPGKLSTATTSPYSIASSTVSFSDATGWLSAIIETEIWPEIFFSLEIGVTRDGLARIRVDEVNGLRQRYNETARWALVNEPEISRNTQFHIEKNEKAATLTWSGRGGSQNQARINFSPLKLDFLRNGEIHVAFNEQNLFHMEHFRVKKVGADSLDAPEAVLDEKLKKVREVHEPFMSEDGGWEETFGGKQDTKPKGEHPSRLRERTQVTFGTQCFRS